MEMEFVLYERRDKIGLLTINRPKALNALNSAVVAQLSQALDQIAGSDIRCLIITGAGEKAFVAGADIAEMSNLTPEQARAFSEEGNSLMEKLERFPMPTIAAVGGYALGGGCELALCCDIRIASETAVFGLPEVSLGVLPGYGGLQRLTRLVGLPKAKELAFTTSRVKAEEAMALGLINEVHPGNELIDASFRMAEKIAANAPIAVRAAKKVINDSVGLTLDEVSRLEAEPFAGCFGTSDQREAMSAFLEKRKPEPFTGT